MDRNPMAHAALLQWQVESLGFYQTIFIRKNAQELFEEMKTSIISDMDLLINEHYEDINCSSLEDLYEAFIGDDFPGDDWGVEDVRRLLMELMGKQSASLRGFPDSPTILGQWYDLVAWLNNSWDGSYDDYLSIPVEGPLVKVVKGLVEFFAPPLPGQKLIDFKEASWIIALRHIASADTWSTNPEMLLALKKLFYEFNERYQF
jgi:hypothetical protein